MKLTMIGLFVAMAALCACKERGDKYVITDKGLVSYMRAYCELGMLMSSDMINIVDENSDPITCSGYVRLTKEAYKNWGAK